jgi:hypothetical protein
MLCQPNVYVFANALTLWRVTEVFTTSHDEPRRATQRGAMRLDEPEWLYSPPSSISFDDFSQPRLDASNRTTLAILYPDVSERDDLRVRGGLGQITPPNIGL